ncbi:endoglucanase [Enterovibrio norvegicus]|uniref:glycosyl hydrolase family 8 n=1 Tax=Enterovibrio norvegicus TaxID=188144 RepID=UPI0003179E73|nr:glycosyl hydrolase family 8 [Enterovibrio norvegicus]OEF48925.1 endoglucanase [Enterovibrio norvegicus]PMH65474.1 endoglucanase [Enterovibrio norvegicus]
MSKPLLSIAMLFSLSGSVDSTASPSICDSDKRMWTLYKSSFIAKDGRVVDTGNHNISHSEGQGYGMLMAAYFNDRKTFHGIWSWTKTHLQRDMDPLFSWKWQPRKPHIPDRNNASDGDMLIAWALHRAAVKWSSKQYAKEASDIIRALQSSHFRPVGGEVIMLPGAMGFTFKNRTVVNPGYWVYPAMDDFVRYSRKWSTLANSGLRILSQNQYGKSKLTSDWVEYQNAGWQPAQGFPSQFSYSSYRIPLYMVWGGRKHAFNRQYTKWLKQNDTAWVDVKSGESASYPPPDGAIAISQLVALANGQRAMKKGISVMPKGKDYYSDSLVLLSHIAFNERVCR